MEIKLKWETVEKEASWNCPWIVTQESVIGKTDDGKTWSVRAKFISGQSKFMVWFDNDEVCEDDKGNRSCPFLRREVVYAMNYWDAHKRYYGTKFCKYEEIPKVVEAFAVENGIR